MSAPCLWTVIPGLSSTPHTALAIYARDQYIWLHLVGRPWAVVFLFSGPRAASEKIKLLWFERKTKRPLAVYQVGDGTVNFVKQIIKLLSGELLRWPLNGRTANKSGITSLYFNPLSPETTNFSLEYQCFTHWWRELRTSSNTINLIKTSTNSPSNNNNFYLNTVEIKANTAIGAVYILIKNMHMLMKIHNCN